MKFKHSLKKSNTHISTNPRTKTFKSGTNVLPLSSKATRAMLWQSADYSWWFRDCALGTIPTPLSCHWHQRALKNLYSMSHWPSFPLPEVPRGKKEPTRLEVVLEWKVRAYHSMKFHRQHCDKPLDWGYKQGEWYLVRYRLATTGADISK